MHLEMPMLPAELLELLPSELMRVQTIANQTVYANTSHAFSGQGAIGTAVTDVGINMTPSGTNIPDLEISKGILIKATGVPVTSDCNASNEGTIVYGKSANRKFLRDAEFPQEFMHGNNFKKNTQT
jgi:hypothetical protein